MTRPAGGEPSIPPRQTPLDLSPEAFADIGHRLVDDVADLLGSLRTRRLTPGEPRAEVRAVLDAEAPLPEGESDPAELFSAVTELLTEHSLYNGHPRFFGYITASPAPIGMLADLLAAAVNANLGAWILSPMATEMEAQAVRWLSQLVGFPDDGDGVLTSGGNVANMLGFWAARAAGADWDVRDAGMRAESARALRAYAPHGTHTWIQKAADLSGLGTEAVRWVATDASGRMDLAALRRAILADTEAGDRPFMVVGTAGSVATGAVDALPELRAVCDEFGLWFHVDGAYGAFAAVAPDASEELRGLTLADSLAMDPHKWLYAPLEAGCTLVRDPGALLAAFSYRPDYYHFQQEAAKNFFEHGIQNSRGFRALKVWLQLRQVGRAAYARMIGEDIELARRFYDIAREREELEAVTHGLSITTYRFVPRDLSERTGDDTVEAYLDELNREIQERMEVGGEAFVSNAVLDGRYLLRMCVVNFRTSLEDVVALADISERLGREADTELRPEGLR